jgi:hypothetical protein
MMTVIGGLGYWRKLRTYRHFKRRYAIAPRQSGRGDDTTVNFRQYQFRATEVVIPTATAARVA